MSSEVPNLYAWHVKRLVQYATELLVNGSFPFTLEGTAAITSVGIGALRDIGVKKAAVHDLVDKIFKEPKTDG